MSIYLTKRWRFHLPGTQALRQGLSALSFLERVFMFAAFAVLTISTIMMLAELRDVFSRTVPAPGGTLTEGIVGTARFINPVIARADADKDLVALVYSGLMRPSPDGTLIPDLAESYTISSDGLTYTFILRSTAVFHDGHRVTADDVVYTIRQIQNPLIGSPLMRAWEGVSVSADDNRTVVFQLSKAYAPFLANTTIGIMPEHLWGDSDEEAFSIHRLNGDPVGSGPFMIGAIKRDDAGIASSYTLTRFPLYTLGVPYLESITIAMFGNARELFDAYERGEVHSMRDIDAPSAVSLSEHGVPVETYPLPRVFGAFFNQNKNPVFANESVREALAHAVDRKGLIETILGGYGTALEGPLPPPFIADTTVTGSTIGEARALLEQAGWERGSDGVYANKGTRLAFSIATVNSQDLAQTADVLKRTWETLGAEVSVELFDIGTLHQNVIRPREYDMLLFGQVIGRGGDFYPFWHSSQRNDPGLNIALYTNIEVDAILADIRTTLDAPARDTLYASLNEEIIADVPAVFLYAPHLLYILPEWLKGVVAGPIDEPSERFMNVHEWHSGTRSVLTASPNF